MIVVAGEVKCDVPGCGRIAGCAIELRYSGGGILGGMGLGSPSTIKTVSVLDDNKKWRLYGLLGDNLACSLHDDAEIKALEDAERAKIQADRDVATAKWEQTKAAAELARRDRERNCPHCGYPDKGGYKGIYTAGKKCDGCGYVKTGFFDTPYTPMTDG